MPFAEGTDAGGSVRIPAAWCNLFGYKAAVGRVPVVMRPDAFGAITPFVHEGLLTRTVEDAVIGLQALQGYDPRDPFSLDERPGYETVLDGDLRGLRIAYTPNLDVHAVDPRIAGVVRGALRHLEDAGAHVEQVELGIRHDQRELSDVWCRLGARLTLPAILGMQAQGLDLLAGDDIPAPPRFWLDEFAAEPPLASVEDSVVRTEIYDAIQGTFADYDLIVSPTVGALPVPNGPRGETLGPSEIDGVAVDPSVGWVLTYLINFTGHPAASVPVGLAEGLPVGMQVVGRRYDDAGVCAPSSSGCRGRRGTRPCSRNPERRPTRGSTACPTTRSPKRWDTPSATRQAEGESEGGAIRLHMTGDVVARRPTRTADRPSRAAGDQPVGLPPATWRRRLATRAAPVTASPMSDIREGGNVESGPATDSAPAGRPSGPMIAAATDVRPGWKVRQTR